VAVALTLAASVTAARALPAQAPDTGIRPVALVTGSTDGLGRELALRLGGAGYHVIVHGRNEERGRAVVSEIESRDGSASLVLADLGSMTQVRQLAATVLRDYDRLDLLVNNAGIGRGADETLRQESEEGHELRFAVNYLSHFYLTRTLLPLLRESAPARIVSITSTAQQEIDFDDVMLERASYQGTRAYAQSKLAQIMMTMDLAEELMISVSNLAKSFGDRVLFEDASFQLNPGERYGLVGANGSGKTTLLNILTGDAEPSEGTVSIPKSARLGVLRQDQFLYEDEHVLARHAHGQPELWEAMVEKEALLARAHEHFDADRFSVLEETFQRLDGYTAEARAATILEGLGLPAEVHHQPLSTLSGGFKLRVLLAQVLASAPDVLLLDEPTNHLDILSIRWLEKFLQEFAGPVVVISHDHRFLDNVSTTSWTSTTRR
jgi:NAD(P)-dependent dehydrogenase (short-subunit alcohol dehydrogenase family)/ABC-type Mn2+/Zn2+ transport system ATPase subunit